MVLMINIRLFHKWLQMLVAQVRRIFSLVHYTILLACQYFLPLDLFESKALSALGHELLKCLPETRTSRAGYLLSNVWIEYLMV